VWQTIDFDKFGAHFKSISPAQQVHQSKFIYNLLSLGVNKSKISGVSSATLHIYRCCKSHPENAFHLLNCTMNPGGLDALDAFLEAGKLRAKENHFAIPSISWPLSVAAQSQSVAQP
jgi:hypothetical protein